MRNKSTIVSSYKEYVELKTSTNNSKNNRPNDNEIKSTDDVSTHCILQIPQHIHSMNSLKHQLSAQLNYIQKATPKLSHSINCISDVLRCPHLYQLKNSIHQYKAFIKTNSYKLENINISKVLNNFLHLLQIHNNDQQFETIKKILNLRCDIQKCKIFDNISRRKNYRMYDDAHLHHILGKIHCYYMHSHDSGNRLTIQEKMLILNTANHSTNEYKKCNVINNQIKKLNQILSAKQEINRCHNNRATKYNHFSIQKSSTNNKMYSVGIEFKYDYSDEVIVNHDNYIRVYAKYKNLKQELLKNVKATVGKRQYDTEYNKAQIHYNSEYRRQKYARMSLWHILSLMFYSNCDSLQFAFSKTYREQQKAHENFYYLGKYIKMAIHGFGTKIIDGNIKVFYHGIGEKLLFPDMIIRIYSPTSTSSQFEVANNFTNKNNGLIVEFNDINSPAKYFSLSWMSDYAYESEFLFIHTEGHIQINNIMDPQSGSEFKDIIKTLNIMDRILMGKNIKKLSSDQNRLILKCFHHQLSQLDPNKYKTFNSLHDYAKRMVSVYCKRKKKIVVDSNLKAVSQSLFKLFFHIEFNGINIKVINWLFPNVEYIVAREINLCTETIDCILSDISHVSIDSKVNKIKILPNQLSILNITTILEKYEKCLSRLSYICGENNNWLTIIKRPKIKLTLPPMDSDCDGWDSARSVSVGSNCSSIIEVSDGSTRFYNIDGNEVVRFSSITPTTTAPYIHMGLQMPSHSLSDAISTPIQTSNSPSPYNNSRNKIVQKQIPLDLSNGFPYFPEEKEAENYPQKQLRSLLPKTSLSNSHTGSSRIHKYRPRYSTGTPSSTSMIQSYTTNDDTSYFAAIDEEEYLSDNQEQNKNKSSKKSKWNKNKQRKKRKKKTKKIFSKLFG